LLTPGLALLFAAAPTWVAPLVAAILLAALIARIISLFLPMTPFVLTAIHFAALLTRVITAWLALIHSAAILLLITSFLVLGFPIALATRAPLIPRISLIPGVSWIHWRLTRTYTRLAVRKEAASRDGYRTNQSYTKTLKQLCYADFHINLFLEC